MCGMYLLQMNSLEATNNHLTREDTQTKQKEKNHHMSIITEYAHYNNDCNTPIANGFVQDIINYNGEEGIHICPLPGNEIFLFAVHFGKLLLFPLIL